MKDGPQGRTEKGTGWAQSRLTRLTQGGSTGAQASIIGFVLVGPILGGFLIGNWLDQKFQTAFWTPLLGLLGVFSGFREMLALLKRLSPRPGQRTPPPGRGATVKSERTPGGTEGVQAAPVGETQRQRLFSVPPPPFMEQAGTQAPVSPSQDEVRNALLGNDEDEPKTHA